MEMQQTSELVCGVTINKLVIHSTYLSMGLQGVTVLLASSGELGTYMQLAG